MPNIREIPTIATPADRHRLGYDLDDIVVVDTAESVKAVADDTRMAILNLLMERAATVTQLAAALDQPKGTIGYHVKVLEDAGLVAVVRTAKVRALTEKYYGRTGRTIVFASLPDGSDATFMLRQAMAEMVVPDDEPLPMFTVRRARIPAERAAEFAERAIALADEFVDQARGGDRMYGLVAGVYPTDLPVFVEEPS